MSTYRTPDPPKEARDESLALRIRLCSAPLAVAVFCGLMMGGMSALMIASPNGTSGEALSTLACASLFFFWPAVVWFVVAFIRAGEWMRNGPIVEYRIEQISPERTATGAKGARIQGRDFYLVAEQQRRRLFVPTAWKWRPEQGAFVRVLHPPTNDPIVIGYIAELERVVQFL